MTEVKIKIVIEVRAARRNSNIDSETWICDLYSYLIDNNLDSSTNLYIGTDISYGWCQIELAQYYHISQLQSVVIYNRITTTENGLKTIRNCGINLMKHNGEIVYSTSSISSSQADNLYYRFDGPDINNVPSYLFTTSPTISTCFLFC